MLTGEVLKVAGGGTVSKGNPTKLFNRQHHTAVFPPRPQNIAGENLAYARAPASNGDSWGARRKHGATVLPLEEFGRFLFHLAVMGVLSTFSPAAASVYLW